MNQLLVLHDSMTVEHIVSFLQRWGWELILDNSRFYILEMNRDIDGEPLEKPLKAILEKRKGQKKINYYIHDTFRTVAAWDGSTPQEVADKVIYILLCLPRLVQ